MSDAPARPAHIFAGNPLDRASDRRSDPEAMARFLAHPDALVLPLWNGRVLAEAAPKGKRLAYVSGALGAELAAGDERLLFLGLWRETPVFALDFETSADPTAGPLEGYGAFEDMRALAAVLPESEAAIAGTAKGVFEWRRRHRFCSACGQPSQVADGGWKRVCAACKVEHFPRTDPVVIMLPVTGEKCLVGRQAVWPVGMWSALAGFLEPGETIEEACARELAEEAGLKTLSVAYHSTQPWPFPNSLMIGLIATIEDAEAHPDQTELEAVRWLTREEARALIEGRLEGNFCPPPLAIAHHLLRDWAYGAA